MEAAKLLGVSEEMFIRWARQGKIPAVSKRGTYRINREDLTQWARRHNIPLTPDTQRSPGVENRPVRVSLFHAMTRGGIHFDVPGHDVGSALEHATTQISLPADLDRSILLEELLQRERLASTGIGNGVAIPHPRYPMENAPEGGLIATCYLKNEIDFNALDGKPVFLLFVMISPKTEVHLKMLSRLTYCLRDSGFFSFLRSCRAPDSLLSRVHEMEKKLAGGQQKGD